MIDGADRAVRIVYSRVIRCCAPADDMDDVRLVDTGSCNHIYLGLSCLCPRDVVLVVVLVCLVVPYRGVCYRVVSVPVYSGKLRAWFISYCGLPVVLHATRFPPRLPTLSHWFR